MSGSYFCDHIWKHTESQACIIPGVVTIHPDLEAAALPRIMQYITSIINLHSPKFTHIMLITHKKQPTVERVQYFILLFTWFLNWQTEEYIIYIHV